MTAIAEAEVVDLVLTGNGVRRRASALAKRRLKRQSVSAFLDQVSTG
ncbi:MULTISPECIES: hypothetical protein [unclassified Rhizobium]|nr:MULTISPECIES: hypothetical protein [unclassified Rhizobium]